MASWIGGGSLTVEEEDGSPSVSGVTKIQVSNATLTNDGSGTVSMSMSPAGGANTALSNLASVAINASLVPGADGTLNLGTAALRFGTAFGGTAFSIYKAASEANPTATLGNGVLNFGAGTTNAVDVGLKRGGAGSLAVTNGSSGVGGLSVGAISPAADATYAIGTTALRFTSVIAGTALSIYKAVSEANPTATLGDGVLSFGAGTTNAVDVGIARSGAAVAKVTNGSTGEGGLLASAFSRISPTTDAAPSALVVNAANSFPGASAGTNATGAHLVLAPGIGRRIYTIVDYSGLGASTVTVTVNGAATVLTEPTHWSAATSNDATATSLAAAIDAIAGVSATASSAVVRIVPDAGTFEIVLAKSAADGLITLTQGDGGCIKIPRFDGAATSAIYLYSYGGSLLNFGQTAGGSDAAIGVGGINVNSYNQNILFTHASQVTGIAWNNGTGYTSGIMSPAAGVIQISGGNDQSTFGALKLDTNVFQYADTVTLSDNVKTAVVDIAIADGEFIGGTLTYTITATDATDHQALTGIVGFSGVRKNGTPDTYHLTIAESATPVLAESNGASTLADTWAIDAGTNVATISVTADSSLTTPTMTVRYQLTLNSANAVTKK